jgi:hypothetical protein
LDLNMTMTIALMSVMRMNLMCAKIKLRPQPPQLQIPQRQQLAQSPLQRSPPL